MPAPHAVVVQDNEQDDWVTAETGSTELTGFPGVRVGLRADGKLVLEVNDDNAADVVFKDGVVISPVKKGDPRKKRARSCGPNDVVEIQVAEGGGPRRTIARMRIGDAGRIIGAVVAWAGGAAWGQRTWSLATDGKTVLFKDGGAPFTQSAAPLTKLVLKKLFGWSDDVVDARFEVRDALRARPARVFPS